jgi:hypothetical protein
MSCCSVAAATRLSSSTPDVGESLVYPTSLPRPHVEVGKGHEMYIVRLLCSLLKFGGEAAGRAVEEAGTAVGGERISRPALAGTGEIVEVAQQVAVHLIRRFARRPFPCSR